MPLERMLSSAEVSDLLGVPVRTLDNWAHQKTGPAFFKVGRSRRYKESDVERWLAANAVATS